MHLKVFRLIAAICSTACLYVFIGLSPHNRLYQNYKYSKTFFVVNPESEQQYYTAMEDDMCCPQLSTVAPLPTPIHQTVASIESKAIVKNTIEVKNNSSNTTKALNKLTSSETEAKVNNKTVDDYHLNCDIHIAMIFTKTKDFNRTEDNSKSNKSIEQKLYRSLTSLSKHMNHKTHKICVHLITDKNSQLSAKYVIKKVLDQKRGSKANGLKFYFHDIERVNSFIDDLLPTLKTHFNYRPNSYYSHSLFFTSLSVHRFFTTIDKLIFLDIDVQFSADIRELYEQFGKFNPEAVIGIAYEQQPVYRHILHEYRTKLDNKTALGLPPPEGWPGFNSGVLLMDLHKMRESVIYNSLLKSDKIDTICKKYFFSGHLGDQDFYTVVSFQFKHLFHVIPCNWNRQLCQWWRYHGYRDVFEDYFKCDLQIKLFHGNCNSALPAMQ